MSENYDIVIAGGGIAGLTAGLYGARQDLRTLVLAGSVPGGHLLSIEKIECMPGFPEGVPGYDLCPMVQEDAEAAGARFLPEEMQGLAAADAGFRVTTAGGEFTAPVVIAATGSRLKQLGVPGEEHYQGRGVSHCASCDGPMLRGLAAVVVGGGDSALQEALTLAGSAASVTILQRDGELTARADYRRRVAGTANISVRTGVSVEEILGTDVVTGVRCVDGASGVAEVLGTSAVFVFIGMQPNSACLENLVPLDENAYVVTDACMRTTRRGLFAAGILRRDADGQAVSSAGDGAMAAIAAGRYLRDGAWPA